jgi:putative flavoprotein involved in K+ transport
MRSEARKETGESLLDHMQVFARGDRETVMAELIMPVNVVLWRGGAVIPAAATPGEELDYLTHHRIFACLSGNCGLQKITLETERVSEEEMMNRQSHADERNRPIAAGSEHFSEYFETVIIGGGQAGLSVGYHLKRQGRPFVILDANERIGDAWRKRWDSLRLFTPARYSGLAGWRFPAPAVSFPTKDEMADYLESYAARFDLPVRTGVKVDGLFREGDRFVVASGNRRFEAEHVVVATGANQVPKVPAFADDLRSTIVQPHSSQYRHPSQLQKGPVLVVGAGNSGAEIAFEVSRTHPTYLSGKPSGQIPVRHGPAAARFFFPVIRFVGHHVLTLRTPIGRKVQPKFISHSAPLIRVKLKDLDAAGVEQVPRTVGMEDGRPALEDGRVLDVSNVIWCTGFRQEFPWIDLPISGEDGLPLHERGVVVGEPSLYFVGLPFQYAATSDVLPGVGRDAEYTAKHIASREPNGRPPAHAPAGARRPEATDRVRTGGADARIVRGA